MATVTGADIGLGTIFTGKVDASFSAAVRRLRGIITDLTGAQGAMGRSAVASTGHTTRLGNEMDIVGKKIGRVSGGFERLTAAMKVTASYGLAATAIFGTLNAFKQGVVQIIEYDQALKNLQAITSATEEEVYMMGEKVKEVSSNTKYSAKEVADAMTVLGQAGMDAKQTTETIEAVATLATGTLSEMKETADLLTTAIVVYGIEASRSMEIADTFANAANKSKLDMTKLATAFNYVAPIAAKANLSLNETTAALMLLANAGLKGSTMGTTFRQVLQRMIGPTTKMTEAFTRAHADISKFSDVTVPFKDKLEELRKVIKGAGKEIDLFGIRGAVAAAIFGKAGPEGFQEMLEYVQDVGSASEMAETQMSGLQAQIKNLANEMGILAITIGTKSGLVGAFKTLLDVLKPIIQLMTYLAESSVGQLVISFMAFVTIVTGVTLAIKYLGVALASLALSTTIAEIRAIVAVTGLWQVVLSGVWTVLQKLWFFLKRNPFVLLIMGVGAVVSIFNTWKRRTEEMTLELNKHYQEVKGGREKLEDYVESLKKVEKGTSEYRTLMKAIIKDFPEITADILDVNNSLEDQVDILDRLARKIKDTEIDLLGKKIEIAVENLKELKEKSESPIANMPSMFDPTTWFSNADEIRNKIAAAHEKDLEDVGKQKAVLADMIASWEELTGLKKRFVDQGFLSNEEIERAERLKKTMQELVKGVDWEKLSPKEQVESQRLELESLGKGWWEYFNKLGAARRADLLDEAESVRKKQAANDKAWKDLLKTPEEIATQNQKVADDSLKNFIQNVEAKTRAERSRQRDWIAAEQGALAQNEADRKKALEDETLTLEERGAINQSYDLRRMQLMDEIKKKVLELKGEQVTASGEIVEGLKKEIEALEKKKREYEGMEFDFSLDKEVKILEVQNEIEKKTRELNKAIIEESLKGLTKYSEEYTKVMKELAEKGFISRKQETNYTLALELDTAKRLKEQYAERLITAEEYYEGIKKLSNQSNSTIMKDLEEARKAYIRTYGSIWDNFKLGMEESAKKASTWASTMEEIGGHMADVMSDNFTDAFYDYIEGTKKAGDAFIDFARNTLEWLMKLIIRQEIYNALVGSEYSKTGKFGGLIGGIGNILFSNGSYFGAGEDILGATGGWLREPIVGVGTRSGSRYTLAEKGPEYLVGSSSVPTTPNMVVNVINKSGSDLDAKSQGGPQWDGERWVLSVVLNAVGTNRGGFKNSLNMGLAR